MTDISKIKLISGWSNPGGSTVAHINLVNLLNENGFNCTFYGPHTWHLGKCRSGHIYEAEPLDEEDILIMHYFKANTRPTCKKMILSCHETNMLPLKELDLQIFDVIHYVSASQKKWHSVNHPSVIIPNVVSKLKKSPLNTKVAGVIGSIDSHKQTHLAIKKALKDGWKEVRVYGETTNRDYAMTHMAPILDNPKVIMMGHFDDKQLMYDSIDAVYHCSKRETFNYIKVECEQTGVEYKGESSAESGAEYLSDKEILEKWTKLLTT